MNPDFSFSDWTKNWGTLTGTRETPILVRGFREIEVYTYRYYFSLMPA